MNIFVKPKLGHRVKIGELEGPTLYVTDRDNYHRDSKSLGLDKEILLNLDLDFTYIRFKFHKHTLITTRSFFADNSVEHNILNFRDMRFMPLSKFGLAKALKYERSIDDKSLASKDIFEIMATDNSRVLNRWLRAIEREEMNKPRRIEL